MARKALEVDINKRRLTVQEIIMREGKQMIYSFGYKGVNPVSNTSIGSIVGNFQKYSQRAVNIKASISVSGDPVTLFSAGVTDDAGFWSNGLVQFIAAPGSTHNIEWDSISAPSAMGMNIYQGDGETEVTVGMVSTYKLITADDNWFADRVIGWVGDSISLPTVNADLIQSDYHHFGVRDWLIKNSPLKETFRLTITAEGGKQSTDYAKLLLSNGSGSHPYDLSIDFYQMGMNDQSQGYTTAAYKTNIKKWLKDRKYHYPGIVLVLLGTTPAQGETRNNNLIPFRTAMAECVLEEKAEYVSEGLNPDKIIGIDLGHCFDRTIPQRYATTDGTSGDALHPGDVIANGQMRDKITEGVDYDTAEGELGINFPTEEHPEGLLPPGGLRQRNIFDLLK